MSKDGFHNRMPDQNKMFKLTRPKGDHFNIPKFVGNHNQSKTPFYNGIKTNKQKRK